MIRDLSAPVNVWTSQHCRERKTVALGAVKAQAKHEPTIFRDQLYKYFEAVPPGDFDSFTNKLVAAGSTLEFLKYSDALFEILLVGGLLQPGGSFVDDGTPPSAFSIANVQDPTSVDEIKKYVDVFNKLIRRYKYLQKPLEESSLPTLLQYVHKWSPDQREKFAITIGLLISQGLASASCLQSLTKDHLVKDDVSLNAVTIIFRTIINDQSMESLASHVKRGGIKDIMLFFPPQRRDVKHLEAHFKGAGLNQVGEWYIKKQYAVVKDEIIKQLKEMGEQEADKDDIISYIKSAQSENNLPETELIHCIWTGLVTSVDWASARPDQIDALALREVTKFAPIIEPFCTSPKTEVALINVVQVYCYEDTRIIKSFPQLLKVLYNKDCVSDKALIYWYQKGAKPQGKQHFLKATEPLVKFLQEQDESEEEEE
ncbi:hypothetical protein FRC02_009097 [Tulasnella sp. 418]|nr:hypothetical protein FRC02_009097 [Tulasnella sp. 418]